MINWNTVPAFYNDSYTYMEWLGKVTAKVEDHETRITKAESDIETLQEAIEGIQTTLEDHEGRIQSAEDDIDSLENAVDSLEDSVDTLTTWYNESAAEAVAFITNNKTAITTVLTTTIPALQEQTAENTSAILSLQREGTTVYIDVIDDTTISNDTAITSTYTALNPVETAVDCVYRISTKINNNSENFVIRERVQIGDTINGISFNADGYLTYTIAIATAGTISISLGSSNISGNAYTDTDISDTSITQADIVLYAGKTVTPTDEKEAYQASVKIFTNKSIPIDNRTASIILQYYSAASTDPELTWAEWAAEYNTEHPDGLQLDTTVFPDTNKDGKLNAIDASNIMTYYANASTGKTQYVNSDADKFYNWYLAGNPPIWEY